MTYARHIQFGRFFIHFVSFYFVFNEYLIVQSNSYSPTVWNTWPLLTQKLKVSSVIFIQFIESFFDLSHCHSKLSAGYKKRATSYKMQQLLYWLYHAWRTGSKLPAVSVNLTLCWLASGYPCWRTDCRNFTMGVVPSLPRSSWAGVTNRITSKCCLKINQSANILWPTTTVQVGKMGKNCAYLNIREFVCLVDWLNWM